MEIESNLTRKEYTPSEMVRIVDTLTALESEALPVSL
jgi:hypothetical protein